MTYEEYLKTYGKKDHILIRMTDSFPFFKEKYIVENGEERIETNYHIADGMFSCYINFELSKCSLAAEITGIPRFEINSGYRCPILITNVGEKSIEVNIGHLGDTGILNPNEVLGIFPKELAEETLKKFEEENYNRYITGKGIISQDEINRLLGSE